LADLHFTEAAPARVEKLALDVRAAAPDAVLVSGDLTKRARIEEFAAAFGFLRALGPPLLVVPGNHDIPHADLIARFLSPRDRWDAATEEAMPLALPGVTIVPLDTVARAQWHLDWSAGSIGSRRRARLARQLATAEGRRLVLAHHPLRHAAWAGHRRPPRGAAETIATLERTRVEALLCGHLHRADVSALTGTAAGPLQVIAPSALSTRGGPNGWNLLTVTPDALAVETRWLA
jgi:3',5'-cyclic AMP phosphodiesterase CpdA